MWERGVSWLGTRAQWRREVLVAVLVGLFMGIAGPFGTYVNGPFWVRLAYWTGIIPLGVLLFGLGVRAGQAAGRRLRWPGWLVFVISVALINLPMSVISALVVVWLWPRVGPMMTPLAWYGQGLAVALPFNLIAVWSRARLDPNGTKGAEPTSNLPLAPPQSRLPVHLGQRVMCLRMEDHYVRVYTGRGSDLVLSSMKDAIAALDPAAAREGMQVHRSWWVARAAVQSPVMRGRSLILVLVNGLEVPVARPFVARLREAGWLGDRPAGT